jgi:hypothetical protein
MAFFSRKYLPAIIITAVLVLVIGIYAFVDLSVEPDITANPVFEEVRSTSEIDSNNPTKDQIDNPSIAEESTSTDKLPDTNTAIISSPDSRPTLENTATAYPTFTSTPTPSPSATPTPTLSPTPSATPTPSITPTSTPRPPSIEVIANELTIHAGPGQAFPALYKVTEGEILVVQSKNIEFDQDPWFLIKVKPDDSEEWVSGNPREVKQYNTATLSSRVGPPTPTRPVPPVISCDTKAEGEFAKLWRDHSEWFGCPFELNPLYGTFAEMPFEKGHIFWLVNIDQYNEIKLALVTIGGQDEGIEGDWFDHPVNWNGEGICGVPSPPDGLYLPDRELAKVWCDIDGLNQLGYATVPSQFVPDKGIAALQNFERAVILRDSDGYTKGLVYILFRKDKSYIRVQY